MSFPCLQQFRDPRRARIVCERYVASGVLAYADVVAIVATSICLLHRQQPGDPMPDCDALANELYQRWNAAVPRPTRVYYASKKTIQRLGGVMPGRLPDLDALSHDLLGTSCFLHLVEVDSSFRRAWVPEQRIPEAYGTVHPDAVIADGIRPREIVEVCGCYSERRLTRLIEYARAQNLPLGLWTIAKEENE